MIFSSVVIGGLAGRFGFSGRGYGLGTRWATGVDGLGAGCGTIWAAAPGGGAAGGVAGWGAATAIPPATPEETSCVWVGAASTSGTAVRAGCSVVSMRDTSASISRLASAIADAEADSFDRAERRASRSRCVKFIT